MTPDTFRFTRFERIYSSREEAIKKLDNTTRVYAECVTIRYKVGEGFETILALYKSANRGDYYIIYDSNRPTSGAGRVFDYEKRSGETDQDVLDRIIFEEDSLSDWDLAIISSSSSTTTYLYHNGTWISLSSGLTIRGNNSSTVNLLVTKDESSSTYEIQASVPIDNTSLCINNITKKLQVGVIDCGNLSDILT